VSLAAFKVPGELDAEFDEVQAFLESEEAYAYLGRDAVLREAFLRLVLVPYDANSVHDACMQVAAILDVLRRAPRCNAETACALFEYAVNAVITPAA
jgi:hypothetical protein